jgi:hypothetical protein
MNLFVLQSSAFVRMIGDDPKMISFLRKLDGINLVVD